MVPDLLSYARLRLVPDDVEVLAQAFEFLAGHESVDPRRVGFVGFSVGGSLAFVAAAESRIAADVRFVALIGPYSDLGRVIMEVTTTTYFRDGERIRFRPESFVWTVTRDTLVATLDRPQDRAVLGALFSGSRPARSREALRQFGRDDLSSDGQRVHDIFTNRDADQADDLVASLPESVLSGLRRLSPVNAAQTMRARVLMLHEIGDPYFPSWESEALLRSLPDDQAQLTLTSVIQHAELRVPPPTPGNILGFYAPEGWKLGSYTFSILAVAED
jgi:acetyl esterase/lipase